MCRARNSKTIKYKQLPSQLKLAAEAGRGLVSHSRKRPISIAPPGRGFNLPLAGFPFCFQGYAESCVEAGQLSPVCMNTTR